MFRQKPTARLALLVAVTAALIGAPAARASFSGFSSPTNFAAGAGPACVATADLNADGILDLAVAGTFASFTPTGGAPNSKTLKLTITKK